MLGPPHAIEIGRRPDDMGHHRPEAAGTQRTVRKLGDAQRDVDPLADDVDERIGQAQLHLDARIELHEVGKHRGHRLDAEGERRRDPDQAGGRAGGFEGGFLRRLAFAQDALGMLGKAAAAVGERQPARGAVEKRGAEACLQPGDRLGYRRLGHRQRIGRARKGAVLHHRGENGPGLEIGKFHALLLLWWFMAAGCRRQSSSIPSSCRHRSKRPARTAPSSA